MRTSILFLFFSLAFIVNANDAINYQAVIRSSDGKVVSSTSIAVQMTIFNDIQSQNMVYKENHTTETNEFGMINLKIGLGQSVFGVFDNINWSTGTFYVQVAVNFSGGNNYEIIGISQLLSVPYALYAKKSGDLNVANMSDAFVKELAAKLNINNSPILIDRKVTNLDFVPIAETKDIVICQSKTILSIEAVLKNIAISRTSLTSFKISQTGVNGIFDVLVNLNSIIFPNLLSNSQILKILILPWNRKGLTSNSTPNSGWRCVIITNHGQIFHNFPNRSYTPENPDGNEQIGDVNKWDESVVWDLPTRRLPSKTSDIFPFSLNPCLPESCYELYPALKNDNGYGNGGFDIINSQIVSGSSIQFPRFYFHNRSNDAYNPFFFMSGYETSNKIQVIGTYRSNTTQNSASRICIFATTDGGRQWYNKYEFASLQPNANGNTIIGKNIPNEYITNSLAIEKRTTIYPSKDVKDPVDLFSYGNDIAIQSIMKSDSLIINTTTAHGLLNGDLIVIKRTQQEVTSNFDFLCNDNINLKNGGNGKVWKVGVLSPTSIKLFEYIHNPDSNLPVRHIHAINKIKDGFIISTGEEYPEGWIIHLQINNLDSESDIKASDKFNFIRLNSSKTAVQRTLGTFLLDDEEQTVVFASDEATISGAKYNIAGRPNLSFSRSSTGIYKGKLADIDDFSKYTCIYEAQQTAFHFKEINGMWIFCGQQGELAISLDKGLSWRKFSITGNILAQIYPKGTDNLDRYFLDQIIIYRK